MSRVPRIRFKGFEEDWEQRKLGDIVREVTRVDENSNAPVMMITANDGFIEQSERYSTDNAGKSLKKYILLKKWELAYNHGASKIRPFGSCVALTRATNIRIPFVYHCFLSLEDNPEFLEQTLNGKNVENQLRKIVSSGARMDGLLNISFQEYTSIFIRCPIRKEQDKIAILIKSLDHLITLHQRKLEKLKIIKKSMLENIFPQNGEKTPKIRFSGFTGDWEQRKAKELCNIGTGKSNTQDQAEDGMYTFYIRSDVPVKSNKYIYDCEAVITIGDGNIGRVFHYVNGKFDLHQRCYRMTDFQNVLGKYFYYFFSTRFYDRAMKMTAKATVDSVRIEMISEMDILMPTEIDEQKNIADFFTQLDHFITLHQSKLGKLKKIKKSMLESMFV